MFTNTKKYIGIISLAMFLTVPIGCFFSNAQAEAAIVNSYQEFKAPAPHNVKPVPPKPKKKETQKKHKVKPAPKHPEPLPTEQHKRPRW